MNIKSPAIVVASLALISACSTSNTDNVAGDDVKQLKQQLQTQESSLSMKQQEIDELNRIIASNSNSTAPVQQSNFSTGGLLPPNAKKGECYARVWAEPKYKTVTESYVAQEAGQKITIAPAEYKWVEEKVLVKEASEELKPVAATYTYKEEKVKVSEAERSWHIDPWKSAPEASKGLLDTAVAHGIDLSSAKANDCFHEHFVPATYETLTEKVLLKAESETVTTSKPIYETVKEKVLVKEASTKVVTVPEVYETVTEKVIDIPAHTVWKKGTGPIQKINEATGEIMCLVDVPATYKTLTRQVLKTPATTKTIEIPAEYKMVDVRKLVTPGKETRTVIPATYKTVKKQSLLKEGKFHWHHVSDKTMKKQTRTTSQICLVEKPAEYETVKQRVVEKEAGYETKVIPAQYSMVKVRKMVKGPQEIRTDIPEIKKNITRKELIKQGQMEWRSILCETNMTNARVKDIQIALKNKGHNPGAIDGVVGSDTIAAMNDFQRKNNLPVDKYINLDTLNALGVSSK